MVKKNEVLFFEKLFEKLGKFLFEGNRQAVLPDTKYTV